MIRISVFLNDCCFQEHDVCVLEVKDVQFEDCIMPITLCSCSRLQTEGLLDLVIVCPSPYVGMLNKIIKANKGFHFKKGNLPYISLYMFVCEPFLLDLCISIISRLVFFVCLFVSFMLVYIF